MLARLLAFVKRNPARTYSYVVALTAWAGTYLGLSPQWLSGIVTLAAIALGESTRTLVTPHEPPKAKAAKP